MLRNLAEADEHEVVKQVNEFYGDYVAVNEDLFTLNIDKSLVLTGPSGNSLETLSMFNQSVQGILAMLLSMKVEPARLDTRVDLRCVHPPPFPLLVVQIPFVLPLPILFEAQVGHCIFPNRSRLPLALPGDTQGRSRGAKEHPGRWNLPLHAPGRAHGAHPGSHGRPSYPTLISMDVPGHGA